VEWSRREADVPWLTELLGGELAESVTDAETHHGEELRTPLAGEITAIRAVFATRAVPGSATFAEREVGDAAEYSAARERGQSFEGYLVDMAL
jgi:hypothetical protein